MSQENVEMVRAAFEAWDRRDWDGVLRDTTPDFDFDATRALGEWRGVHIGPDQVKRLMEVFTEPWETVRFELDEVIEVGDQVLEGHTATMRGRGGIEVGTKAYWVWTFRGGKLIRIVHFEDREEALEAAGLSE